jgi:hypothetical protein
MINIINMANNDDFNSDSDDEIVDRCTSMCCRLFSCRCPKKYSASTCIQSTDVPRESADVLRDSTNALQESADVLQKLPDVPQSLIDVLSVDPNLDQNTNNTETQVFTVLIPARSSVAINTITGAVTYSSPDDERDDSSDDERDDEREKQCNAMCRKLFTSCYPGEDNNHPTVSGEDVIESNGARILCNYYEYDMEHTVHVDIGTLPKGSVCEFIKVMIEIGRVTDIIGPSGAVIGMKVDEIRDLQQTDSVVIHIVCYNLIEKNYNYSKENLVTVGSYDGLLNALH